MRSIRKRLIFANVALLAGGLVGVLALAYWATIGALEHSVDQSIEAEISELTAYRSAAGTTALVTEVRRRVGGPNADKDAVYLLTDELRKALAGNLEQWPEIIEKLADGKSATLEIPRGGVQVLHTVRVRWQTFDNGQRLLVGRDVEEHADFERALRAGLVAAVAGAFLLVVAAGLAMGRHLLSRVQAMNGTILSILSGRSDDRVPISTHDDEFDELALHFNDLLDENHHLIAQMREVTANIAHDLRSPLSRMRGHIEAALESTDLPAQHVARLDGMLDETNRLLDTFNGLLQIAQIESGTLREKMEPVAVERLLGDLAELYEPVAQDAGARLDLLVTGKARIEANQHLLSQALSNLLDNAIKYGAGGGVVELGMGVGDGRVRIFVGDHGPGIPADEHEHVLERFVRLDSSRGQPGNGLGLSLVAAVADLHGATLRLDDNQPGLRVTLSFVEAGARPDIPD